MQKLLVPKGMRPGKYLPFWLPLLLGLGAPLSAQINYATPYTFQVLAGLAGNPGSTNATGSAARFNHPYGMAIDSSGNLYVADKSNDLIRKVTPAGVVTTIAGTAGLVGAVDGTGTAALFNSPSGVAVDGSGNVYVADTGNNTIRKITPAGVSTTIAGTPGTSGSTDGTGPAASFSSPYGVAVDGSGNVYVTDSANATIRKITSAGVSSTFAGVSGTTGSMDGTGTSIEFNNPIGIAIDSSGNLYVTDTGNNTIRKITSAGVSTTIAGNPGVAGDTDGTGVFALFNSPRGIAVDSAGNIFVADSQNCTIRKVTQAGVVTTLAGSPGNFANATGTGAAALFDVPFGVAVTSGDTVFASTELGYLVEQGTAATALAPSILLQPVGQTIASGSTVVFRTVANGLPAPTYQWYLNGVALTNGGVVSGATGPTLVVGGATPASAGSYTCVVSNASGSVTSATVALTVGAASTFSRLTNISCRSQVGTGTGVLILGFAVGGAGTSGSEPLLIRASGPALGAFDVSGFLPDPNLEFFAGAALQATNFGWAGNAQIAATAVAVSAFPWTSASSLDSALLETVTPGAYTAQVNGQSGDTGVALAEVYDATLAITPTSPRLVNISARSQVSTGGGVLIAGFVINGTAAKTVLIRASGPAISPYLTGTLADPELQLYSSGDALLGSNFGWGGDAIIAAEASSVGAFPWTSSTSNDSALLITLPPGAYTAAVAGASGDSGIALLEVYEIK
jgi:sugar lactone lactonase YvrE